MLRVKRRLAWGRLERPRNVNDGNVVAELMGALGEVENHLAGQGRDGERVAVLLGLCENPCPCFLGLRGGPRSGQRLVERLAREAAQVAEQFDPPGACHCDLPLLPGEPEKVGGALHERRMSWVSHS